MRPCGTGADRPGHGHGGRGGRQMQRYARRVHLLIGWRNGYRRHSHHPRRQCKPLQGSAGESRIIPDDDGMGRTEKCPASANFNFHILNRVNYEIDSDRKDFQKTETL